MCYASMWKAKGTDRVSNLQKKLNIKNIHAVPKVDKVIVAMGIGSLVTRKSQKDFSELETNLQQITGQKPRMIKSKQAISNFKLREDMPVMLQVTLRWKKAYDFLQRFTQLALPRSREFEWLNPKGFDTQANISIGVKNYDIFPELSVDSVNIPMGLQISIINTANNKDEARALLEALGFVFKE